MANLFDRSDRSLRRNFLCSSSYSNNAACGTRTEPQRSKSIYAINLLGRLAAKNFNSNLYNRGSAASDLPSLPSQDGKRGNKDSDSIFIEDVHACPIQLRSES